MTGFLKTKNNPNGLLLLLLKLSAGILVLGAGLFLTKFWLCELKTLLRGVAGPFLILTGLLMVAAAKE